MSWLYIIKMAVRKGYQQIFQAHLRKFGVSNARLRSQRLKTKLYVPVSCAGSGFTVYILDPDPTLRSFRVRPAKKFRIRICDNKFSRILILFHAF